MPRSRASGRQPANITNTQTLPPPSPVAAKWTGPLGWNVTGAHDYQNIPLTTIWNDYMVAGDWAGAALSLPVVPLATTGNMTMGFVVTKSNWVIPSASLAPIDTALQARDGPVTEYLLYEDDNISGVTIAQKVATLQANALTFRNYVRANGAPPFKLIYVPPGPTMVSSVSSALVGSASCDVVVFQTQVYEESPIGADPNYVNIVTNGYNGIKAAGCNNIWIQVQTYNKSNPSQSWSSQKVISDINAVGAACNPVNIAIQYNTNTQLLETILANYRTFI